jgi:hypothetical protein
MCRATTLAPVPELGVVMSRQATLYSLPALIHRDRPARSRRRSLERELADYSSDADRNDLQVLADASVSSAAWEVGEILSRQAHGRLYRSN